MRLDRTLTILTWVKGISLTILTTIALLAITASRPAPKPQAAVKPQIVWDMFDVSGFMLLSPAVDSLGTHLRCILPEGAILSIPRLVVDSTRVDRRSGA